VRSLGPAVHSPQRVDRSIDPLTTAISKSAHPPYCPRPQSEVGCRQTATCSLSCRWHRVAVDNDDMVTAAAAADMPRHACSVADVCADNGPNQRYYALRPSGQCRTHSASADCRCVRCGCCCCCRHRPPPTTTKLKLSAERLAHDQQQQQPTSAAATAATTAVRSSRARSSGRQKWKRLGDNFRTPVHRSTHEAYCHLRRR
jgi:hypothetical protein